MKKKTVWDDIASSWKRVAAVIAAVGIIATGIVKIFNTPQDITYTVVSIIGLALLILSWYVDKQTRYIFDDMEICKKELYIEFEKHKKESDMVVNNINTNIDKLIKISQDTRKDTLRIQLLMVMKDQPENVDTILKLAQVYFVDLKGDWYMTSEFNKWAKKHDVIIPQSIFTAINAVTENH